MAEKLSQIADRELPLDDDDDIESDDRTSEKPSKSLEKKM